MKGLPWITFNASPCGGYICCIADTEGPGWRRATRRNLSKFPAHGLIAAKQRSTSIYMLVVVS